MRLTLRTLLAWLDDKLPPAEVREIGKQVADSPYAKELVERIHRVTRQRRLTVPPNSGGDAVDPNLVAAYIDNELEPERVGEYEKKCLTSDVHLAEVSSVHQILSLVGQKAKVPAEARLRMYGLIKGRESLRPKREEIERAERPDPGEPIQPWVTPAAPQRPWFERYGPAAAVVGLIGILGFSAWSTLTPPEGARAYPNLARLKDNAGATAAKELIEGKPAEPVPATPPPANPNVPPAPPALANATKPESAEPAEKAPEKTETMPPVPDGAVGIALKSEGVLLKHNADSRDWDRLADVTPLKDQDRLLNLAPFRSSAEVGTAKVDLVGEADIAVRTTPKTHASKLSLNRGRLVLHGTAPSLPFEVEVGGQTITLRPDPGMSVGVERIHEREVGTTNAGPTLLRLYLPEGSLVVTTSAGESTLDGPGSINVLKDGATKVPSEATVAPWVTEAKPTEAEASAGAKFREFLRPDRPVVSSLVEASEGEEKEVCRLAVSALRAVGDISYVVPLLNARGTPVAATARNAAVNVLRDSLSEGEESVKALSDQLKRDLGDEVGPIVEKLLMGYTPEEAKDEMTYAKLVELLESTDENLVAVRELAIENLRELTGREAMGYNPEAPDEKGVKAWRDLLSNHELKAAAKRAAKP